MGGFGSWNLIATGNTGQTLPVPATWICQMGKILLLGAWVLRHSGIRAFHCREAESQAFEVVLGVIVGLAVSFYGAEKFTHGAFKTVFKPASLEGRAGISGFRPQVDSLFVQSRACSPQGTFATANGGGVLLAEADMGIEVHPDLGTLKIGDHLGEEWGFHLLVGCVLDGSVDALDRFSGKERAGDIKPMDAEVIE